MKEIFLARKKEKTMDYVVKKGVNPSWDQVSSLIRNYYEKGEALPRVNVFITDKGLEIRTDEDLSILLAYMICDLREKVYIQ